MAQGAYHDHEIHKAAVLTAYAVWLAGNGSKEDANQVKEVAQRVLARAGGA